jgi:hypothetical protein
MTHKRFCRPGLTGIEFIHDFHKKAGADKSGSADMAFLQFKNSSQQIPDMFKAFLSCSIR